MATKGGNHESRRKVSRVCGSIRPIVDRRQAEAAGAHDGHFHGWLYRIDRACGFAKDLMGVKVVGSVNLGFVLIALNYVISWTLAIIYERIANGRLDTLASRTVIGISTGSR
jgi:hypothetical protein